MLAEKSMIEYFEDWLSSILRRVDSLKELVSLVIPKATFGCKKKYKAIPHPYGLEYFSDLYRIYKFHSEDKQ